MIAPTKPDEVDDKLQHLVEEDDNDDEEEVGVTNGSGGPFSIT